MENYKNYITDTDIEKISEIIKTAGKKLLCRGSIETSAKEGLANYVTDRDLETQNFLVENLKKIIPAADFLAEESDDNCGTHEGLTFVIDPIDGTANFIRDLHNSAISVGLYSGSTGIFGLVYQPYNDRLFSGILGQGSYLNGSRISVSERALDKSIVGLGTSPYYREELGKKTGEIIGRLLEDAEEVRRFGSAAQDLCLVAAGMLDCFFELRLSPWDFAAGTVIIKEAGGIITDLNGNTPCPYEKSPIICGSGANYRELLSICRDACLKS